MKDLKANSNPDIKVFLIGNKVDLEESRLVPKEKALQFKKDFDLDLFMETSAKTGLNTQEIFVEAARVLYFDYMKYKRKNRKPSERVKLEKDVVKKEKEKSGCVDIIGEFVNQILFSEVFSADFDCFNSFVVIHSAFGDSVINFGVNWG